MPLGVFEHIIEYIPSPRVWEKNLTRLGARSKLAPLQTLMDTSTMIDEILSDTLGFTCPTQKQLLVKLSRCPPAVVYLKTRMRMPEVLLEALVTWADTQSLLYRSSETEVVFKATFARNFITIAFHLFRWFRTMTTPSRIVAARSQSNKIKRGSQNAILRSPSIGMSHMDTMDIDPIEPAVPDIEDIITDAGGDEEEGEGDDDEEEHEDYAGTESPGNVAEP